MRVKKKVHDKKDIPPPLRESIPSFSRAPHPSLSHIAKLRYLVRPHVESFDYFLDNALPRGISAIKPVEMDVLSPGKSLSDETSIDVLEAWVENLQITPPTRSGTGGTSILTPRHCRELKISYGGNMTIDYCFRMITKTRDPQSNEWTISSRQKTQRINRSAGDMPIMVSSRKCHLRNKTPRELIKMKEEDTEVGGYFIVNGNERVIRMLQLQRRNHMFAMNRPSFKKRGPMYTTYGVSMRSASRRHDETSVTNTLHYLSSGGVTLRVNVRKQEFLIPVLMIVKAVGDVTDEEIYDRVVGSTEGGDEGLESQVMLLVQDYNLECASLKTRRQVLRFLGERMRLVLGLTESTSAVDAGERFLDDFILIHCHNDREKLECLVQMIRKLYALVSGKCGVDNSDSCQNHELLLPGHLFAKYTKECFENTLNNIKQGMAIDARRDFAKFFTNVRNIKYLTKMTERYSKTGAKGGGGSGSVGDKLKKLLSTGNVISTTGLDLMQASGFTIMAERINFWRFLSHFRGVHRGAFFMEMRTTAVRKLLPDQWGFICPVHTPDGGPCGLLQHLALKCHVVCSPLLGGTDKIETYLCERGVKPCGDGFGPIAGKGTNALTVHIDGRVLGTAEESLCRDVANVLRRDKVSNHAIIPANLEVAFIPTDERNPSAPYPGLFLFTGSSRMVRPVLNRSTGKTELIGPMAQPFLTIACLPSDIIPSVTTHQELDPCNMLDLAPNLTPYSDQNQSPRNMYQCQMSKQTMGTPIHSLPHRTDNKLYKLQTPQAPVVQTMFQSEYKMDEYPNGTNAVVAVLSYTGFDMEDAMILNKSSYERGMCHGSVYKNMTIDLNDVERDAKRGRFAFANATQEVRRYQPTTPTTTPKKKRDDNDVTFKYPTLSPDGLPVIGSWVEHGDPIYCVVDTLTKTDKITKHKERERAYVQSVRLCGVAGDDALERVGITLRIPRNPVIGDKFASRHGQKGVLSILWPQEDMPFSESGISPDIIINPHAFPSRMTIGMLVESMAGKAGALHGRFQDATPFTFHESSSKLAVDYFGEQLQASGYNYYGSEPLYSGLSGRILHADLYIGVVYYQRLRHMVSDKYQCRATGAINPLTRQPVGGRKRGGGIRLGEMERDSLLSHGCSFTLLDRLMNCSDRHVCYACGRCGDFLSPTTERSAVMSAGQSVADIRNNARLRVFCRNEKCRNEMKEEERGKKDDKAVQPIVVPYVLRYLINELAGMNIKMSVNVS